MQKLITFLLLNMFLTVAVYAQPTVTISGGEFSPGDTYVADFTFDDFSDILEMNFFVTWDTEVLEYDSYVGVNSDFASPLYYDEDNTAIGSFGVNWETVVPGGLSTPDGEVFFRIRFRVVGECTDHTMVEIPNGRDDVLVRRENSPGQNIRFFDINNALVGVCISPLIVSTITEAGQMGERICLPVSVENYENIISFQFTITWDEEVLTLADIDNFGLSDLNDNSFGTTNPGEIVVSYLENDLSGSSVDDGHVIFELCFDLIGDNGTSTSIGFNGNTAAIEVIRSDYEEEELGLINNDGRIFIRSQEGTTIVAPEREVEPNTEICVPITVRDFIDIRELESTLVWDTDVLEFVSARPTNALPGLGISTVNVASGQLSIQWQSFTSQGITLNNGTALFDLCFRAVGTRNTESLIAFLEPATTFTNTDGRSFRNGDNGLISIPTRSVGIQATNVDGMGGDAVCVEVKASEFTNIQRFALPIIWETGILEFDSVGGFNIPFLDESSFTISSDFGDLSVEWESPNFNQNVSVPNGTTLFKLYFTISASARMSTCEPIAFDFSVNDVEEPTVSIQENMNSEPFLAEVNTENGESCVVVADPLVITDSTIVAQSCPSNFDGNISIEVEGGAEPYIYRWNEAFRPSSSSIGQLEAGNYSVTVVDTEGDSISASFIVPLLTEGPIANAGIDTVLNCNSDTLMLNGLGSSMGTNFFYSWTELDTGLIIDNGQKLIPTIVGAGAYELVVIDTSTFCQATDIVTVANNENELANAGEDFTICPRDTVTLDGSVPDSIANDAYLYEWFTFTEEESDPLGMIISGGNTAMPTVLAGRYMLHINDTINNCFYRDEIFINEYENVPTANAGEDQQLTCAQNEITLEGSASPPGNYNFFWTTEGGIFTSDTTLSTVTVNNAGTYIFNVENLQTGCVGRDTVTITADDSLPEAFAGADRVFNCNSTTILIDDSAPMGDNFTYAWAAGDGGMIVAGTDNQLNVEVSAVGNYILTVTDTETGCSASDELIITPVENNLVANAGADVALNCGETAVLLDGTGSTDGDEIGIEWSPAENIVNNPDNRLQPSATQTGIYTLTITDAMTGCTATDTVEVLSGGGQPTVIIAEPAEFSCTNSENITLDGSASDSGEGYTYNWQVIAGGATITDADAAIASVDAPGTFQLTVTTPTGCSGSASVEVTGSSDLPNVTVSPTDDLFIDCANPELDLFGDTDTTQNTFAWSTEDGRFVSPTDELNVTIDAAGTYNLTATNTETSCTATATIMVAEGENNVSVNIANPSVLNCNQTEITLDATASSLTQNTSILWNGTEGPIAAGANTLEPTINVGGEYTLILVDTISGCQDQQTIAVTANLTEPIADAGVNQNIVCDGTVILDGSNSTDADTYQWTAIDGGQIDNSTNVAAIQVSAAGTYILMVSNATSFCTATDTVSVTADAALIPAMVEADFGNCGKNDLTITATPPSGGAIGEWTTPSDAFINDPTTAQTTVSDLVAGENVFIWTLSTENCSDYSADTLVINISGGVVANNDLEEYDENTGELIFDVTQNDVLTGIPNFSVQLLSEPIGGTIERFENGDLTYTAPLEFTGEDEFRYEICNLDCENACDTALVRILVEKSAAFQDSIANFIPSGITPNGDGANDVLIFDLLEENPEQFSDRELIIFNRWGDIVYSAQPYMNDWGGTADSGEELPQGTYYFILRLDIDDGNIIKGDITILK